MTLFEAFPRLVQILIAGILITFGAFLFTMLIRVVFELDRKPTSTLQRLLWEQFSMLSPTLANGREYGVDVVVFLKYSHNSSDILYFRTRTDQIEWKLSTTRWCNVPIPAVILTHFLEPRP